MSTAARLWRAGWTALAAAGAILLVAGFLGTLHPAFDSLAHFRAHIAAATALAAVIRLLSGRGAGRPLALSALAVVVAAGVSTAPYLLPGGEAAALPAPAYRLLQFNAQSWPASAAAIVAAKPDIVTLQETPRHEFAANRQLAAAFPHRIFCTEGGFRQRGVAILSRHPFAEPPVCDEWTALVSAVVMLDGQRVRVASQHLYWPWPFSQNVDLSILASRLRSGEPTTIIGGDFNAAPWSAAVRRVASLSGTTPVPGIGPTWLLGGLNLALRPYVGLPIDNVLTSGVRIGRVERLGPTASDHLPVLVEFALEGR